MNKLLSNILTFGNLFERKYFFYIINISFIIIGYFFIVGNFFALIDMSIRGFFMKLRVSENLLFNKDKITLVGIDEDFFIKEGTSVQGLHRGYYSKALSNIRKSNPLSIGIDVFFENKHYFSNYEKYGKTLNLIFGDYDIKLGNSLGDDVVLGGIYDFNNGKIINPDQLFLKNNSKVGHVHSVNYLGKNTIGINSFLEDTTTKDKIYPLSLVVYMESLSKEFQNKINQNGIKMEYKISSSDKFLYIYGAGSNLNIPIVKYEDYKFLFTPIYISKIQDLKNYISFYDVYIGNFDKSIFENKIVLIGATDLLLNDIKQSLVGTIPGVMMHLNMILSYINNDFIYILDNNQLFILLFSIILLNIILLSIFKNAGSIYHIFLLLFMELFVFIIIGGMLAVGYFKSSLLSYSVFLPIGTMIFLIFFQITTNLVYFLVDMYFLKENFQKLFSLYVGEKLVDKSSREFDQITKREAKEKNISIYFSDVVGFTSICENLSPNEVEIFLNRYFEIISRDIANNKGFIDKYIGDGIMAFWENDKYINLAPKTAILNILRTDKINKEVGEILGERKNFDIDFRIGLNYGKAIVGDLGSELYKLNHTIIGDEVNLASRIEGLTRVYGVKIIITQNLYDKIKDNQEFITRRLDKIIVKGKHKYITIYELFPFFRSMLSKNDCDMLNDFILKYNVSLEYYFGGNFKMAKKDFQECLLYRDILTGAKNEFEIIKKDNSCELMLDRCNSLMFRKIENWDGIWKYDSK